MAKFRVNVCLAPCTADELPARLAAAMAPFDYNRTNEWNPAGEWDWWRISAGRGNRFAVRPAYDGDARLVHGDDEREPLHCDGGPRGLLDFDATRRHAVERARAAWHTEQRDFQRLVADHPPAQPLTAFLARHEAEPDRYSREAAVADHHAQPLVRALNHQSAWERYPSLGIWVLGPNSDPITRFTRDPQPGFDDAAAWAVAATALLTVDGQWIEPDRPGPFRQPCEDQDAGSVYAEQSTAYLDGLEEDCIIVRLLCHC